MAAASAGASASGPVDVHHPLAGGIFLGRSRWYRRRSPGPRGRPTFARSRRLPEPPTTAAAGRPTPLPPVPLPLPPPPALPPVPRAAAATRTAAEPPLPPAPPRPPVEPPVARRRVRPSRCRRRRALASPTGLGLAPNRRRATIRKNVKLAAVSKLRTLEPRLGIRRERRPFIGFSVHRGDRRWRVGPRSRRAGDTEQATIAQAAWPEGRGRPAPGCIASPALPVYLRRSPGPTAVQPGAAAPTARQRLCKVAVPPARASGWQAIQRQHRPVAPRASW